MRVRTERFGHDCLLTEGVAAAAGARRVGIRDVKSGALQRVGVFQRGAVEQFGARGVDDDLDPGELAHDVILGELRVMS